MNTLNELVSYRAIENVLYDYCRYLDSMDLARLAALFTEDCHVVYGSDVRLQARGQQELETSLARMWRWRRTAHHLSNIQIRLEDSGQARAESCVWAWHEASDGTEAQVFGVYRDVLVKEEDAWRISDRRMTMKGSSGAFRVAIPSEHRACPPKGWVAPDGLDG